MAFEFVNQTVVSIFNSLSQLHERYNIITIIIIIIIIILIYGIYMALYPDAQSVLQHFVGDFNRLLI